MSTIFLYTSKEQLKMKIFNFVIAPKQRKYLDNKSNKTCSKSLRQEPNTLFKSLTQMDHR